MEKKVSRCNGCGSVTVIVNRTRQLCDSCNFKRLHNGKSRFEFEIERKRGKPKIRHKTGELELFRKIWGERPHYCVKCGKWLGNDLKPIYFSHIKSKGAFPALRLDPTNIELLCEDCHYNYEFNRKKGNV